MENRSNIKDNSKRRRFEPDEKTAHLEKLQELIRVHPDWSQTKLAEEIGISVSSVFRMIKRHQLNYKPKERKNNFQKQTVKSNGQFINEDRLRGLMGRHPEWTVNQLAYAMDVSKKTVEDSIKHYGIKI
ncbi:hypothetical protein AR691_14150 [Bacillus amyloliquefaciens]|nr:hypothetical protein AR691_14150 [Bacillus amyloliquefaciens]